MRLEGIHYSQLIDGRRLAKSPMQSVVRDTETEDAVVFDSAKDEGKSHLPYQRAKKQRKEHEFEAQEASVNSEPVNLVV